MIDARERAARIELAGALGETLLLAVASGQAGAGEAADRSRRRAPTPQATPSVAPSAAPARTSSGKWTRRYTRESATAAASASAGQRRRGQSTAIAVAAANVVPAWPEGNEALCGVGTSATSAWSCMGGRGRSKSRLRASTAREDERTAVLVAAKAIGKRRRHVSAHKATPISNGPLTHQADNRTKTAVSQ